MNKPRSIDEIIDEFYDVNERVPLKVVDLFLEMQDIVLNQSAVEEVTRLKNANKSLSEKYIGLLINYFEMMNHYQPDWKLHCEPEIEKLNNLLK